MATAFTLATNIFGKRTVKNVNHTEMQYYMNDGIYGTLQFALHPNWTDDIQPEIFNRKQSVNNRQQYTTTLFGPTCDSKDFVFRDLIMPELHVGDWLVFRDLGAYSLSIGSQFNAFPLPAVYKINNVDLNNTQILTNYTIS